MRAVSMRAVTRSSGHGSHVIMRKNSSLGPEGSFNHQQAASTFRSTTHCGEPGNLEILFISIYIGSILLQALFKNSNNCLLTVTGNRTDPTYKYCKVRENINGHGRAFEDLFFLSCCSAVVCCALLFVQRHTHSGCRSSSGFAAMP